jgi:hypothetical protein
MHTSEVEVQVREDVEVWEGDVFYGMSTQYAQVRGCTHSRVSDVAWTITIAAHVSLMGLLPNRQAN